MRSIDPVEPEDHARYWIIWAVHLCLYVIPYAFLTHYVLLFLPFSLLVPSLRNWSRSKLLQRQGWRISWPDLLLAPSGRIVILAKPELIPQREDLELTPLWLESRSEWQNLVYFIVQAKQR